MDSGARELVERALQGDGDGVVAVLRSMSEAERRACAPVVLEARDSWREGVRSMYTPRLVGGIAILPTVDDSLGHDRVRDALQLAEFGVFAPSRIRPLTALAATWHRSTEDPRYEEILRLRPRAWREKLLARANWPLGLPWPVAYRLVRDGLADPPDTSWYYAASVWHIEEWREDSEWLAGSFWRSFTHEEAGVELSRGYDKAPAYRELADSGRVPRDRLLSACLDALRRDFHTRATRFYRALFDALEPTTAELEPLTGRLLALLAADNKLDVGLAPPRLLALQRDGRLDSHELLNALPPALTAPTKKHALAAIKLGASVLRSEPEMRPAAVEVLSEALFHRRSDVQRAAFDLIEPHLGLLSEEKLDLLRLVAEDLDPAIAVALGRSAPGAGSPASPPRHHGAPGRALRTSSDPPPAEPLEDPFSPGHFAPPPNAHGDGQYQHFYGWDHRIDWRFSEALLTRVRELAPAPGLQQPLSTPTDEAGWIAPAEAARRLWHLAGPASLWDLAQMILRLAPDIDGSAHTALEHLDSEEAAITRYALGQDPQPPSSPPPRTPIWRIAEAFRHQAAYEHLAQQRATAAREQYKKSMLTREWIEPHLPDDPLSVLESDWMPTTAMLPWLTTFWPSNREPVFRMVTRSLWRLRPDGPFPQIEPMIAILADPRANAGPEAGLALALCLGIKDIGLRTFAAQTVTTAIATGSATGTWLGAGLARALIEYRDIEVGLPDNKTIGTVPRRWVEPLTNIARTSPNHATAIHTALSTLLAPAPPDARPKLNDVLNLLRQLTLKHQLPIENPDARRYLETYSPRTQGGRIAQEILSVNSARRS